MHYGKNMGAMVGGLNDVEDRLKKGDRRLTQGGAFPIGG